jgi:hypothetical protein
MKYEAIYKIRNEYLKSNGKIRKMHLNDEKL